VFNGAMHKSTLTAFAAFAAVLACAAPASAKIVEVGRTDAAPACPDSPCLAVSRTTGYQVKVADERSVYTAPEDGKIVAWSIALGKPTAEQIAFFDKSLGGESQAAISVLRMGTKLHARLVAQGEVQKLTPFFGQTVEFALQKTIPVKKGWVLALTVPTWAPALAAGLGGDTSWRASRAKGTCDDSQAQTAQAVNQIGRYYCLYRTARIMYSARVISTP
jgi:hypothetical protein